MDSIPLTTLSSPRQVSHGSATRSAVRSAFMGVRDTDRLILLELDDVSFSAFSSVSLYAHSLYDEELWALRFERKYGVTLWTYAVSHRDVYIAFSKLEGGRLEEEIVKRGFINLIERFLVNSKAPKFYFIWAAKYGQIDVVRFFLDKGVELSVRNRALVVASEQAHLEIVKLLLDISNKIDTPEDITQRDIYGEEPLRLAKLLLDKDADICANKAFMDALDIHCLKLAELFFDRGANISVTRYLIEDAVGNNEFELVKFLLDKGAKIGLTLQIAVSEGHFKMVTLLLDRGATMLNKALELACERDNLKVVTLLLDRGANIHSNNDLPLRKAALTGRVEIVKLLIDRGANVNAKNGYALQYASKNVSQRETSHESASQRAYNDRYKKIVELLHDKMNEESAKEVFSNSKQCLATTIAGNQCKRIVKGSEQYCKSHVVKAQKPSKE